MTLEHETLIAEALADADHAIALARIDADERVRALRSIGTAIQQVESIAPEHPALDSLRVCHAAIEELVKRAQLAESSGG
jgi:hypothetical protein